jgi:hypothetical protein
MLSSAAGLSEGAFTRAGMCSAFISSSTLSFMVMFEYERFRSDVFDLIDFL